MPTEDFSSALSAWRQDGAVLIPELIPAKEIEPVYADFEQRYGTNRVAGAHALNEKEDDKIGVSSLEQFRNTEDLPFDSSPAMNLIALHPTLISLARAALQTEEVFLYQAHSWAKFTGAADYDQRFHCDFNNHTLVVPSDDAAQRTINFVIYISDVTDALGAIHYVPLPVSDSITGPNRPVMMEDEMQTQLKQVERSGAAPAGSVFAYGIDVYHRGTNLTDPGGHRYTFTASYKVKGNDMIAFNTWPRTFREPWHWVINYATPDQLSCLGFPHPGDPFWTPRTLARTAARWPELDLTPYRSAATAQL